MDGEPTSVITGDVLLTRLVNGARLLKTLLQPHHRRVLEEAGLWALTTSLEPAAGDVVQPGGGQIQAVTVCELAEAVAALGQQCKSLAIEYVKDDGLARFFPPLHFSLYSACCLVLRPDIGADAAEERALTGAILQRLVPACARLYATVMATERPLVAQHFRPRGPGDWLWGIWAILCYHLRGPNLQNPITDDAPCNNQYIGTAISILSRLIRIYLPWLDSDRPDSSTFEFNGFDLRAQSTFVSLLQAGLLHADSATRKQSLYLLKQTVKFSTLYLGIPATGSDLDQHHPTPLFQWTPSERQDKGRAWQRFFLLYESVHETQAHIVEPLLPMLKAMITGEGDGARLDQTWWQIVLERAIAGDSGHVRRRVLQAVLEIDCRQMGEVARGRALASADFFFGKMLGALDCTALYQTDADEGASVVSIFGLSVAHFYARYLAMAMRASGEAEDSEQILLQFLEGLFAHVRSATPMLFLLQTLLHLDPSPLIAKASLRHFISLAHDTVLFHNLKARRLARWQLLYAFMRLANTDELAFTNVADALHGFFLEHSGLTTASQEYVDVAAWLRARFPPDYIDSNLQLATQQYFASVAAEPYAIYGPAALIDWKANVERAEELSTMLAFTLDREEGGFAQCVRPLYQQLAMLAELEKAGQPKVMTVVAAITLFVRLNQSVSSVSAGRVDLLTSMDVSPRLYEWLAAVEAVLLGPDLQELGLEPLLMLLEGMQLFLGKAVEKPDALVAYVNMVLYKLVELVNVFARHQTSQEAEDYPMQLRKLVTFGLMARLLRVLEQIEVYHLGFTGTAVSLQCFFDCELEKPPRLSDSQADEWDNLVIAFSVCKWSLISTLARFSHCAPEIHRVFPVAQVFERCLLALESAKYKSVLAILECMRGLTEIPPADQISVQMVEESIAVLRSVMDEMASTPVWYYLYAEGFIDYLFQPALLARSDLAGGVDSPLGCVLDYLIHGAGVRRKNVVARLARNLASFWSTAAGHANRMCLLPFVAELLQFGPSREEGEDRVAQSLTLSNHQEDSSTQRSRVVESLAAGADYLVRTQMNSVLLHLDPAQEPDHDFALAIFDTLLDSAAPVK